MRGKKTNPEEYKLLANALLGEDYKILNEYKGSNSYIELYHIKCDKYIRIRANHILDGTKCKCEKSHKLSKEQIQEIKNKYNINCTTKITKEIKLKKQGVNISRELLYSLYINRAMKRKDLADYLQVSETTIKDLLSKYNIKKDKDTIRKSLVKVNISKDELYDLYITQNLSELDIADKYNVSKNTIINKLKEYSIIKSKEQKKLAFEQYSLEKYGTKHPTQSKKVKEKQKETNLKKYGSVSALQNKEVQEKTKHTNLEKYGSEYFLSSSKYKEVLQDKYGVVNTFQMLEVKNKIKETNLEKYGVENVAKLTETRRKSIKSAKSSKSKIDGTRFDSSWEVLVYDYCLRHNIPVKTQIPIKYIYHNKEHITYIDFKIDNVLYEVKGSQLINNIINSGKIEVYKQNNVVLIGDRKLENLLEDYDITFVDINSFRI